MRRPLSSMLGGLGLALGGGVLVGMAQTAPVITHGVASGDVTARAAVVWARSDRAAEMTVRYVPSVGRTQPEQAVANSSADTDFAAQVRLTDLEPGTRYRYEVWFSADGVRGSLEAGTFATAPSAGRRAAVSFIWAGDLGGQAYCRQRSSGYAIFTPMTALDPDFFVANGDMIYADSVCPAEGPQRGWINIPGDFTGIGDPSVDWTEATGVQDVYAAHWRYNRADPAFQQFLRTTPMYVQWDDHEVINDFGAPWSAYGPAPDRAGYPTIVEAGRKTLFDYHPFDRHPVEPDRIYRSYRWGQDLELFILDARSYRSENQLGDDETNAKTMLGTEQLDWLKRALAASTATWKVVSTDVPLSVPTGTRADEFGRDAFASGTGPGLATGTGFESELLDLLRDVDARDVRNLVFVATDVHFAAQLRYELDLDGDGDPLLFHELVSGPLSAVRQVPPAFDPTLHPVVLYAEGDIFNFGTVRIGDGSPDVPRLRTDIRDDTGRVRPGSQLELLPQP